MRSNLSKALTTGIVICSLSLPFQVSASEAEVNFVNPEKFSDIDVSNKKSISIMCIVYLLLINYVLIMCKADQEVSSLIKMLFDASSLEPIVPGTALDGRGEAHKKLGLPPPPSS